MEMKFDPMTGEPISPENTPAVQEPKKGKMGKILGGIFAAVVVIALAIVLIKNAFIGKGGKVLLAFSDTFADAPTFVKSANLDSAAKLIESGKYTLAFNYDQSGKYGVTVDGKYVSTAKEKQLSGEVSVSGIRTNGTFGVTNKELLVNAPMLGDDTYVYNYKKDTDGYIVDVIEESGMEIEEFNALLNSVYQGVNSFDNSKTKKFNKEFAKKLNGLNWKKLDKKSYEVDGKNRKIGGYGVTLTGDDLAEIVELYEDYYEDLLEDAKFVEAMTAEMDDIEAGFEEIYDACDEMDDMQLDFYIYKNKIAAFVFEVEDVEGEFLFKGGDYRLQNVECTIEEDGDEVSFEIEGETNGNKEILEFSANGEEGFTFEYDKKSGDFSIEVDDESLEGNISKKGKGFEMKLELEEFDLTISVTGDTKLEKYEGDKIDVSDLDEEDWEDIMSDMYDNLY